MGALHAGHMALIAAARADHPRVVATIFVNPTQFGNARDLELYPRTEAADLAMLKAAGCDAVFIPQAAEIYPQGDETIVETTRLSGLYHGAIRPDHFRGVATVVTKLFNIVQADTAYFGQKDYQQLAVIRAMVRDLHIPVSIVGVPTVREPDGLAMSSRNVRLTPADRVAAVVLNAALFEAETLAHAGGSIDQITTAIRTKITAEPRASLKAIDIVDPLTFGPPTHDLGIMISAQFGDVLLIDQREVRK
jgi:pantoate--beta-alanine ligase